MAGHTAFLRLDCGEPRAEKKTPDLFGEARFFEFEEEEYLRVRTN
jgi:hypothetical protein